MKKCFMCCLRRTWWFLYCYVPSLHKHIIVTFLQIVSSETHICSNLLFLMFDVTIYNFASGVLSHETFIYNAHTWSNVHAYNLIESVPRLCFSIKKLWCMVGNECAVNNKSNLKMNKCYMSVLIIRTTMQMTIVFFYDYDFDYLHHVIMGALLTYINVARAHHYIIVVKKWCSDWLDKPEDLWRWLLWFCYMHSTWDR